jgi:hypothetical protein
MNKKDLDTIISWRLDKYLARKKRVLEGHMQDQITIELRVDFADKDKIPELIKIACAAARHMVACVQVLQPVHRPECVVFTDNFMSAPEKIDIYADLIAAGQEEMKRLADSGVTGHGNIASDADAPSSELLEAIKGA